MATSYLLRLPRQIHEGTRRLWCNGRQLLSLSVPPSPRRRRTGFFDRSGPGWTSPPTRMRRGEIRPADLTDKGVRRPAEGVTACLFTRRRDPAADLPGPAALETAHL